MSRYFIDFFQKYWGVDTVGINKLYYNKAFTGKFLGTHSNLKV